MGIVGIKSPIPSRNSANLKLKNNRKLQQTRMGCAKSKPPPPKAEEKEETPPPPPPAEDAGENENKAKKQGKPAAQEQQNTNQDQEEEQQDEYRLHSGRHVSPRRYQLFQIRNPNHGKVTDVYASSQKKNDRRGTTAVSQQKLN